MSTPVMMMIVVPILFIGIINVAIGCNRSGRNLLVEDRSAREIIQRFKNDFDMNVAFGLRKMGINRRSGWPGKEEETF